MNLKRGDVWLADLNPTQGSEQAGIRPIIIFQAEWKKARTVLKQEGLELPPYSGGVLFTIAPETGQVNQIAS